MDRLDAMSTVVAVAEAGSLSAASRQLRTPLATVSRKVSDLESHLGTKLFSRTSRKLALTEAGASYLLAARRILADVSEAERAASGEYAAPRGELIVTAPVGLGRLHLIPILTDFFAAYPDIDVRLLLSDRVVSLAEDHVDVALRVGRLPDSSLMAIRVGAVRRVLCASPGYLARRGTPETPEELTGHDCISNSVFLQPDTWSFFKDGVEFAVPIRPRLVVSHLETASEAARAGIGIAAVTSYHVADALEAGAVRTVLDAFQPPAYPVHLLYAAGRFLPIKLRAFLDFMAPRLRSRLPS
jgi:DNA-binding transcriptional LysR family regulator